MKPFTRWFLGALSVTAALTAAGLPPDGTWSREVRENGETWTYRFTVAPASNATAAPAPLESTPRNGGAVVVRTIPAPPAGDSGMLESDIRAIRTYLRTAPGNAGAEIEQPALGQAVYFHGEYYVSACCGPIMVTQRASLDGVPFCESGAQQSTGFYTASCNDSWTATAGTHTLQWQWDHTNSVDESNESNNIVVKIVAPSGGDTTAPVGSIVINGGNAFTTSTSVTLALSASDAGGVTGYYLSTDPMHPTAGQAGWVGMSPTTSFNNSIGYPLPAGDGSKTVYAWYKDGAGNVSARSSDSITLDQTPPSNGTLTATPGPERVTLSWSGQTDATSGLASTKLVFAFGSLPPPDCGGPALATTSPFIHGGLTPGQTYTYRVCATDVAGNTSSGATASATPLASGPRVRDDVDADARADIFWRNTSTGQTSIWFMNGTTYASATLGPTVPPGWAPAVAGDFDGDSRTDFFWRNASTGDTYVWLGWNGAAFGSLTAGPTIPVEWMPVAAGDFNGDGNADIFWHNGTTGETSIWFMNGATYLNAVRSITVPASWTPVLLGDFNGDTEADLFWRNPSTGETSLWMGWNGTTFAVQVRSVTAPPVWVPVGAGDVSGDETSDILWRNTSTGQTSLWVMNGAATPAFVALTTAPTSWSPVAFGDYDADARTDVFWHNPTTGETSIWTGYDGAAFTTQIRGDTIPTAWVPFHSR